VTGVTDPTITPFVQAAQAAGWMVETEGRGRCAALGRCPKCQNPYLFSFMQDASRLKACPFCQYSEASV
jgi:uncharacterized protein (DUF983 family)